VVRLAKFQDEDKLVASFGAMRASPALWDFDAVLYAIEHPKRGFDQDRYLALAADTLHRTNQDQRARLFDAVEDAVASGKIKHDGVRWLSAVCLLRLINADWRPPDWR